MIIQLILVVIFMLIAPKAARFIAEYRRKKRMTASIPGHEGVPLFGNIFEFGRDSESMPKSALEKAKVKRDAGEPFLKAYILHQLVFIPWDGKMLKYLLDSNEEITKGDDYDIFVPWLGRGLLTSTGDKWRARRKMLTPTFHFTMLDGYIGIMNRHAKILVDLLEDRVDKPFDIYPSIKMCALDVICEAAMGKDLGSQLAPDQPYVTAIGELMILGTDISMKPLLWSELGRRLLGVQSRFDRAKDIAHHFTKSVIMDRIELLSKGEVEPNKRAFLDLLIEQREKQHLSMEDIREEVDTFMFEGHDTTSSGLAWTVWTLATNPDKQERAYEELREIFGETYDHEMTREELNKIDYLERCIKEAMRLYPPVPFVIRHLQNDMTMGDYKLPRGANVFIAPYVVHRNEQIYANAEEFDPDRFLPDKASERHPYDYIPFSAGPRNCIGQKFAVYEEKVIMASLLRRYKFETSSKMSENRRLSEVILRPGEGVVVTLRRRT